MLDEKSVQNLRIWTATAPATGPRPSIIRTSAGPSERPVADGDGAAGSLVAQKLCAGVKPLIDEIGGVLWLDVALLLKCDDYPSSLEIDSVGHRRPSQSGIPFQLTFIYTSGETTCAPVT